MARLPKGYRTNININSQKIGLERRQEMVELIADKGTFLPKGVLEEDMDQSFLELLGSDKGMGLTIDGAKVPVIFLTIQRWTEFSKTWQFSDKYKNIELPFITVVRKPDIQQGQNQAGLWNIPGGHTYTYMKVPTWDGIRKGVDLYKIPQPTSVDMLFEVRLFTNRMKDLNKFNRIIQRAFQSRQRYLNVNGHPMPLHLESIGDESNIDDFENRRFYIQMFEMKLLGYILDEEDFEVIPTANRTMIAMEVDERLLVNDVVFDQYVNVNSVTFTFDFKPRADTTFNFISQYDISFNQLVGIIGISNIEIRVNGNLILSGLVLTSPIIFNANDSISIKVTKGVYNNGIFKLMGNTI
jgi:hypothetical protein